MKRLVWSVMALLLLAAVPCAAMAARDGYVTDDVNMRAGPDVDYPVIDVIPAGSMIYIEGCTAGWAWCDVIAGGNRGWVSADYIEYEYRNRRVLVPAYGARIGIPILSFAIGAYWDSHYRHRSFYRERSRWYRHRPMYRPEPRLRHRPDYRPRPRPVYRPGTRSDARPVYRPEHRPSRSRPTPRVNQRPATRNAPSTRPQPRSRVARPATRPARGSDNRRPAARPAPARAAAPTARPAKARPAKATDKSRNKSRSKDKSSSDRDRRRQH